MGFPLESKELPIRRDWSGNSGMTLVETLFAMVILLLGLLSMAQVAAFSIVASKTYGRDATKTTAYAHNKMEELTGLDFTDTVTNTTVAQPFPANGKGLTAGGSVPPNAPTANYVDFLDGNGVRTTTGNALFTRQWQVVDDGANLKRVIVAVTSTRSFRYGRPPSTTVVTYKAP